MNAPRRSTPSPDRLAAMAAWAPRVLRFAWSVEPRFRAAPLPEYLAAITPAPPPDGPALSPEEMVRVIWNILRWNRGRLNNGCFVRSLTRYHFLRRLGWPVVFHLGVEPGAPSSAPRSHAWLTLEGAPFLESEPDRLARYRPLFQWPAE